MARAELKGVVVVVPALAKSQDGHPPVVPAQVSSVVGLQRAQHSLSIPFEGASQQCYKTSDILSLQRVRLHEQQATAQKQPQHIGNSREAGCKHIILRRGEVLKPT